MKKGVSHIDWIVSMGLFIIYVLVLFIFIRPGYQIINEGNILLKIVEDNFKEQAYWTMIKIPLFINTLNADSSCIDQNSGNYKTPQHCSGDICYVRVNFPYEDIALNFNGLFIRDKNNNYLQSDVSDTCGSPNAVCNLDFGAEGLTPGETESFIYTLFYNETIDYSLSQDPIFKPEYKCNPPCNPMNGPLPCFTYIFGVSENIVGISENKLGGVDIAKDYPTVREANLKIFDKDGNEIKSLGTKTEPPININVYVRQWNDWILNINGTIKPVTVNIRGW